MVKYGYYEQLSLVLLWEEGILFMRIDKLILTGMMAGVYSGILDGLEQGYELNGLMSGLILAVLTITTGYILHKSGAKEVRS